MLSRPFRLTAALLCLIFFGAALTGCGAPGGDAPPAAAADNCGRAVHLDAPPERAVGYFQHPVELMLALGLQDSIVATVYPDNPPLPRYAEAYQAIPQLSDKDASFEQILSTAPDFVYGGYGSAFDDTAGRSRQAFDDAGIATYLNPEYCATGPITMDHVYAEITTIAGLFGVPHRADGLIQEMRAAVEAGRAPVDGVEPARVFVYDSGEDTAFTAGRQGIGDQIIRLAGGTNVFSDVEDTFADVSWEQVVQRDPEVIVIYDYFGTPSVEDKKAFLRSRPELADVAAIRDDRFAVLTLQDAVLGVRAPYAVETLARQLHPDRFA